MTTPWPSSQKVTWEHHPEWTMQETPSHPGGPPARVNTLCLCILTTSQTPVSQPLVEKGVVGGPHRSQTAERVTPFTLSKEAKGLVLKVSAPIFQLRWGDLFKTSHVTAGPTWQERKTRTRHHKDDHPLTQFPESHMRTPPWVNHAGNTQPPGRPPRKGQYPMPLHPYNLPDTGVHPTPATGTVKCG